VVSNMADGLSIVLNEVLCFIRCKYATVPAKQLKSCLVDFYDADGISTAKVRLLNDIEFAKISVSRSVKIQHGEFLMANLLAVKKRHSIALLLA